MIKPALVVVGTVLGAVLVWLSFRDTNYSAVLRVLSHADIFKLILAALIYFSAIFLRIVRWRLLLRKLGDVTFGNVSRGLIVGFATNFALPGRLGEVFRADVTKEVSTISRASTLGTILVERATDGLILVGLLIASLTVLHALNGDTAQISVSFLISACGVFAAAALAVFVLRRVKIEGSGFAPEIFGRFKVGLLTLNDRTLLPFSLASALITSLEALSIGVVLLALGLDSGPLSAVLVLSVASLSTLLPTAPAYLGSYQFAFVLAFSALGWPSAPAIAAAFLVQAAFFVPVMIVGFGLALQTYLRPFFRAAASAQAPPPERFL